MTATKRLIIGVVADCKTIDHHTYHSIGEKYIRAITEGMDASPLLIPAMDAPHVLETYLSMVGGILLTGSPSNVEPHHYGGVPSATPLYDQSRDATTLSLIPMAIKRNIPILGICRGFQEINVALGGTLHQKVQDLPGMMDHREDSTLPPLMQYGPAHSIRFEADGLLHKITGTDGAEVNSLHQQGIKNLAPELAAEALAPDGLIEAFRLNSDDRFVFATQWHPEWDVTENAFYQEIFSLFKQACEARQ
mgnify:CR=1 FL=1